MIPIVSFIPIVNSQQRLVAFAPDFAMVGDEASLDLLCFLYESGFLDKLSGLSVFLPIQDPLSLSPQTLQRYSNKNLVLMIQESACASKEAQARLSDFSEAGYRIFMDNFSSKSSLLWSDTKGIAIDCLGGIPGAARPWIFGLHKHQHYAKNVATVQSLSQAQDVGFALFSGEYPFVPVKNGSSNDPSARSRLLKLLNLVTHDADSEDLEVLFKQDSTLSFMLLKLVSSAAFAQTVKVASFKQAINLLGRRQLQRWLQLLLYARQGVQGAALNPLMLRAAFRANLMETLYTAHGATREELDCAFMVGMFSLLDLLFGSTLFEVLKPLNISDELRDALLVREGKLGQMLKLVELADRRNTAQLAIELAANRIDPNVYYSCIGTAYAWVNQVSQDI